MEQIGLYLDSLDYRGFHLDFFTFDNQQIFAVFNATKLDLGICNNDYKEDAIKMIDARLDLICLFSPGGKLMWFQNGSARDIKLDYKNRVLKIWLVNDPNLVNLEKIKLDAGKIIHKFEKILKSS